MVNSYVSGSHGFIGKHLIERLTKAGDSPIAVPHAALLDHLFWMMPSHRWFFISTYGNMASHTDPHLILRANVEELGRLIVTMMREEMVPTDCFLYMSSSSVNLGVQTVYSRTKRAGEEIVLSMPVNGCVVRPYSVTGLGEQPQHLIPTLIRSCMGGEHMNLVLEPVHDYVNVEDVVNGLLDLTRDKKTGVYEFGTGIDTSNEEVLAIVESVTGKKANVSVIDSCRPYDATDWYCKSPAAEFRPTKSLSQTIQEMVEAHAS